MSYYDGYRYVTYRYRDETSPYDPKGEWNGSDTYERDYVVRVPRMLLHTCKEAKDMKPLFNWIEKNEGKDIWR